MYDIIVRPLPPGCRLTAIYDCCHSGGALNLPYEYVPGSYHSTLTSQGANGLLKVPNILRDAGHQVMDAATAYTRGDLMRVVTDASSIFKMVTRDKKSRDRVRQMKTSPADVIQLSGCKNYETSADSFGPVFHS